MMKVRIVNRRDSATSYTYTVSGSERTTSSADVNCTGTSNSANCIATAQSNKIITPAMQGEYTVTGATFSLLLEDRRIVVVNCAAKTNWTEFSMNPKRSCRIPMVN